MKNKRGFATIGLYNPKHSSNIAGVLRAIGCYGADLLIVEGCRYSKKHTRQDTAKQYKHTPLLTNKLKDCIPKGAVPIAVDLVENATCLYNFTHPERAYYIFGPEDGTLDQEVLSWCKHKIYIPTKYCLNLAMTVNTVLYDRN